MAKAAKTAGSAVLSDQDEPLELTSINDRLVNLPDESVIDVDISDHPELAAEEDAPVADPARHQEGAPAPEVDDGSQETLAALRKRMDDQAQESRERIQRAEQNAEQERQRRQQAETNFRQREQANQEEARQREIALLDQGIATAQTQLETLAKNLATAKEAGNFADEATISIEIGRATARLDRMETEKATFEAGGTVRRAHEGAVEAEPAADRQQQPPPTTSARFEQFLGTLSLASAQWIRNHPECAPPAVGGNNRANAKMMAGHWDALARNVELESPEYFKIIEEHTGHRQSEAAPTNQPRRQAPVPGQRRAIPAAPPSREVPGQNQPGRTRQVRLSKEQQEAALLSFPHLKPAEALAQYARNLVELEAEGLMGRRHV